MTAPGSAHLDADSLADLAENLLDASAAEAARRHVESCVVCSDDYALITGAALVSWDEIEPEPIPADVVARVEAALHREPPLKPSAHPAAVREARQPRSRRFLLAFKLLATSSAVLVAGYVGVTLVSGSGGESKSASNSAAVPAAGGPQGGAIRSDSAGGGSPSDLSPEQRAQQLLSANAKANAQAPSSPMAAGSSSAFSSQQLTQCWAALRPGRKILRSTPYTYQGSPAELLIFEVVGVKDRAEVIVATAECPTPRILDTTSVPIPQ